MGGDAYMAYLARRLCFQQGLQRAAFAGDYLHLGRGCVMHLIQVDMVGAEVFKAGLYILFHCFLRAGHALGGENELIADTFHGYAEVFLAYGIAAGGVYVVDAVLRELVYEGSGLFLCDALDRYAAEAEAGNLQAGAAEISVLHAVPPEYYCCYCPIYKAGRLLVFLPALAYVYPAP